MALMWFKLGLPTKDEEHNTTSKIQFINPSEVEVIEPF